MREKKQGNLQSSCSYFTRKLTLSWVVAKFVKFSCFFVDIEKRKWYSVTQFTVLKLSL